MFTPPPSPLPFKLNETSNPSSAPLEKVQDVPHQHTSSQAAKRRTGRRFRLAVISIPLIMIILTLCASYSASRAAQDSFNPPSPLTWHSWMEGPLRRMQKREPEPEPQPQASPSPSPSQTSVSSQPVPTVPSSPPAVPTPFPQPFDGTLSQNFSTTSCSAFFSNMTSAAPFRACRPFSILLQTSATFVNAQTNLTLMNSIIWGTCNTNIGYDQCKSNMDWFASSLKSACSQELKEMNSMAVNTLLSLQAYEVMHDVGCLQEPTSNTYCYLNAVRSISPADSYYYGLPLGIGFPKSTVPSCSSCSKSVMGLYAAALKDPAQAPQLTGLKATYEPSTKLTAQQCGADFAQGGIVSSGMAGVGVPRTLWMVTAVLASWLLLQGSS